MNVLQDASATLNNSADEFISLSDRVTNRENITLSSSTSANLDRRITAMEQSFAANQALFNNTSAIMGLINQNYDLVRSIINNQTSVEISYNLDLLQQGNGILLDRSTPNTVKVNNSNQDFNIGTDLSHGTLTQNGNNEITLLDFSNYFKHINGGTPLTLNGDMTIRIKDSTKKWKLGQRFRLSFGDRIYPGEFIIPIVTDFGGLYPLDSPSGVSYSTIIITLDEEDFSAQDYMPVIDIVCIDERNLKFQVDCVGKSLTNN
jgi:hypothetical protein